MVDLSIQISALNAFALPGKYLFKIKKLFFRFSGDDCSKRALGAFGAPENCGQDIQATNNWKTLEGQVTAKGQLDNAGMTIRQAECHYHIKVKNFNRICLNYKILGSYWSTNRNTC